MKRLNKVTALLLVFLLAFSSFGITALAEGTEPETMQANETPLTPEETADTILQRLRDFVDTIKRFIQAIKDFIYGILGIVKPIYIPVDSVSLSDEFLLMSVGDTVALTPIISPDDASKKQVAWASDDESVATVDANGNVLAVGTGFATITVTTVDGGKTASVQVLVGDIAVPADGSIQAAIDAASPGQVIAVAPGVYREQLSVYKAIVLLGPNFDIPGSADRGPEAVITYPDGADITNGALIDVSANNVFIKGFSCLNEEATAPVDAHELIFTGVNIEFTNNRVVSAGDKIALYFGDANAAETDRWGLVIAGNYIESGSRYAALVVENTGAIIETNEIYGGSVALQISPLANTVGGAVNDNVLQAADAAILHENAFNGSGEWSYDGNIIAPLATANAFRWPDGYFRGFAARSIGVSGTGADPAVSFAGNIIEVPEDYDEAVWSETIGFHFIADISDTAVFDFTGNTIAGVTFGAVRDAGLADLDAILADNTFPEGSMVTGNVIKVPTWADMADTSWFVSSNTSFTLTTGAQLAGLAALVNSGTNFNGKTVNLGADIDLMNLEWTPIGNASNWFRGIFNGNDYKISGLKITDNTLAAVGLFGYVRASSGDGAGIRNLEISGKIDIKDANVMSPNVGLVAGLVWGFVENCRTTDVKADNTIIYKSIFSQSGQHRPAVGGLVGYTANSGYPHNGITGSSFTGTILVETTVEYIPGVTPNSGPYLGGLVGMANRVNVSGSTVNADITGNAYRYMAMGGIIGYAMGEKMSFNDLTFTGDLNGHTNMVGESASTSCSLQMGGIVGAGEFAGDAGECGVVNATVSGSLTADIDGVGARVYTGGVVGYVYPYWRDPLLAKFEIVDCNVDLQHNVILDSEASVYTGGLAGIMYNDAAVKSTIEFRDSVVAGEINVVSTVVGSEKAAYIGGLLGYGVKNNSDSALDPDFIITNCTTVTPNVSLDYATLVVGEIWGINEWE